VAAVTSFVVETYVQDGDPGRFAADVEGIRAATQSVDPPGGRVHHVRSYLVPSDQMGFHVVEGDSAEDVVRLTELASIEVERIVEAIGTDEPTISPEGGNP
jgi:hypothetical protein